MKNLAATLWFCVSDRNFFWTRDLVYNVIRIRASLTLLKFLDSQFIMKSYRSVADPRGGAPLWTKIFLISCSFWENPAYLYVGAPSYGKSCIRPCRWFQFSSGKRRSSGQCSKKLHEIENILARLCVRGAP